MIRFLLFYFYVLVFRASRLFVRLPLTGDTNYLSSPLWTIHRILSNPLLGSKWTLVDVGCGEGLVGLYVRLIKRQAVILHDHQSYFLSLIRFFSRLFFLSNITCSLSFLPHYPSPAVFLCVWTSWSKENRLHVISELSSIVPKGSFFISVSHGIVHPSFIEIRKITEMFAWGQASVYYYKHA